MKKAFDDYIEKMLKERENCESNANNEMKGTLIDLIRDNVRQREKMGIKVNEILKKRHLNKGTIFKFTLIFKFNFENI
jgi:hypothetical protein